MHAAPPEASGIAADAPRPRPGPDLGAGLCGLAGLVLLARFPQFGPLLAWPLLFVVPGTLLTIRAVPALTAPGRLGVGIVVSVLLSTHLGFLLSLALGFHQATLVLTVALLMAASWLLATRALPGLAPPPARPTRTDLAGCWRRHRTAWEVAGALTAGTAIVLWGTLFHHLDGGWKSGAANWSDFLLHVSIAASIQHGNFPPQVPFFAGEPLTYHYFGDLNAAIAASLSGLALTDVMGICSTIMVGALALVVFELCWQLCAHARAAGVAAVLTVLGGGLGWSTLAADLTHGQGDLLGLLRSRQYDFGGSLGFLTFAIPPVYEVGLLVQRATAYGLPMLVGTVLVGWVSWGRSAAGLMLAGAMAAMLAPFDFFAVPVVYMLLALVVVARRGWRESRFASAALALAVPAVYAASFLVRPLLLKGGGGSLQLVRGWQASPLDQGPLRLALFYLANLGIPFVLATVALCWRRTPARLLLGGWIVILFIVPNVVQVSFVAFDSSKFFQLMWPAVAILAALLMRDWPRVLVVPTVALSCLAGLAGAVWAFGDNRIALSDAQYTAARWIDANTPEGAVFVTPSFVNMPTDLAGRLRVTGFFAYATDYGYDQAQRDSDVFTVYCGGDAAAAEVMRRYGATYVLAAGYDCRNTPVPTDFERSAWFVNAYRSDEVVIYRLRP